MLTQDAFFVLNEDFFVYFSHAGWWFVDLDGEFGWVPASFLTPRDGEDDFDDHIIEVFDQGEGKKMSRSIITISVTSLLMTKCLDYLLKTHITI